MPALSPTMNQGNIATWRKKEGDKIEVGDVICEIETDKPTLEFKCLEEGYLAKILAPEGSKDVLVGQPIAITVEDPADIETVKKSVSGEPAVKDRNQFHDDTSSEVRVQKTSFSRISPSAKLLIAEHRLDASSITTLGHRGTLLKGGVLSAIKSGKGSAKVSSSERKATSSPQIQAQSSSPVPAAAQQSESFIDIPNTQIRKSVNTLGTCQTCYKASYKDTLLLRSKFHYWPHFRHQKHGHLSDTQHGICWEIHLPLVL